MSYGPGHCGTDESGWATEIGEKVIKTVWYGLGYATALMGKGICFGLGFWAAGYVVWRVINM